MIDTSKIHKNMDVIAANGQCIGSVCGMHGRDRIRMTSHKAGYGYDHLIPLDWVSEVNRYVFLNKAESYVAANWENAGTAHSPWARSGETMRVA